MNHLYIELIGQNAKGLGERGPKGMIQGTILRRSVQFLSDLHKTWSQCLKA